MDEILDSGESVTLRVDGACMAPYLLHEQDVVVCKFRSYLPGDILVYWCTLQNRHVAHRLLGRVWTGADWKYLLIADSAYKPDTLVSSQCVIGKVAVPRIIGNKATRVRCAFRYFYWVTRIFLAKIKKPK